MMKNKISELVRYLLALLIIVGACLLNSCNTPLIKNLVKIHYRVLFNAGAVFPNPNLSNEFYTPGSNGLFVIYQITAIDNNDTQPNQFNFSLNKVFVQNHTNDRPGNVQAPQQKFNTHFQASQNAVVAPGATGVSIGDFVILVNTGSFPLAPQDQHAFHPLLYASDPGESVLFIREGALRPNFPGSFQQISQGEVYWFDQMPSHLFQGFLSCNRGFGPSVGCSPQ